MHFHEDSDSLTELRLIRESLGRLEELLGGGDSKTADSKRPRRGQAHHRARHFLRAILLDGPLTWDEVKSRGDQFGHSERTLRRARPGIADVVFQRDGQPPLWRLKEEVRRDGA